jgi:ankyrin repeat protein
MYELESCCHCKFLCLYLLSAVADDKIRYSQSYELQNLLFSIITCIFIQDIDGNAPIHLAAVEGFDTIVSCLITFNCNVNIINSCGKMALHYLAMKGHWLAIKDIVHIGGFLDHLDNDNHTPLWYAVHYNRQDAVKTLLQGNCAPHPVCNFGGVPLESALLQRQYSVAKWLLLAGAPLNPLYDYLVKLEQDSTMLEDSILQWLTSWARQPLNLRHLCRNIIRTRLRRCQPFVQQINGLGPLPTAVRDFICLREIDDVVF